MAEIGHARAQLQSGSRRRLWLLALMVAPLAVGIASWWLTEPLDDRSSGVSASKFSSASSASHPSEPASGVDEPERPVAWPEGRLEGRRAKTLLLDVLLAASERINQADGYTATFSKQERIDGQLRPKQTMAMKVRHRPFAVYFKFLTPQEGKEVVYAEGRHDNKVVAHAGGVARFLVPRLAVPPDHPLALADARHSITEAGLANLTARLIGFRRKDLEDPEAVTVLDTVKDASGRVRLRSFHSHPTHHPDRPFARVEVLYDPETFVPVDIRSFDWPEPGHEGDFLLAEHYSYDELNFNAALTALDFDVANPAYSFHRY